MVKSVLISIRPEWCALIASGEKTIEVRKTRPMLDTPFECYIYCTQGKFDLFNNKNSELSTEEYIKSGCKCNGKVIGEFNCKKIDKLIHTGWDRSNLHLEIFKPEKNRYKIVESKWLAKTLLTYQEVDEYSKGGDLYGWHISDLIIYDEPKELSEFINGKSTPTFNDRGQLVYSGLKRPPQSWCYVEEQNGSIINKETTLNTHDNLKALERLARDVSSFGTAATEAAKSMYKFSKAVQREKASNNGK